MIFIRVATLDWYSEVYCVLGCNSRCCQAKDSLLIDVGDGMQENTYSIRGGGDHYIQCSCN